MPYNQRMEGVPSSASSPSSDPAHTIDEAHPTHLTQDSTQFSPLIHASGGTDPIDTTGYAAQPAQPLVGYAHHPQHHHHHAQMYADHANEMAGVVIGTEPAVRRPTLQEANDAMDLVIEYLDKVGPEDLLKGNERQVMTEVKCALFSLSWASE